MKNLKKLFILGSAVALFGLAPGLYAGVDLSVGIVIKNAPPPPRHEVIVARPSPRHVWIGGYWRWEGGRHVWVEGRWELPPRAGVVYVPAHWDHRPEGFVFVAGAWRDTPPPVAVVEAKPAAAGIIVTQAPPPPPAEQMGPPPGPGSVWLAGYWRWADGAFVWTPGSWAMPPAPHSTYVAAHWEARDNGFAFCQGYWQQGQVVAQPEGSANFIVTEAPPPPMNEVIVARPSHHHVWIAGHWLWREGRYVWIAGRWELPPHRHAVYVAPRWERRGHGYVYVEGFWR